MACKHTNWVNLANQETSLIVRQTARLQSLVHSLPSPSSQHPALVLLLESNNGRILTANEPCSSASPGTIHLCLDQDTALRKYPLIIASAFPIRSRRRIALRKGYRCCSTISQHNLPGPPSASESRVYSQFLFPFVDVFCFVYHHPADLENIVQILLSWTETLKQSAFQCILPEIIIIISKEAVSSAQASKEFWAVLTRSSLKLVPEVFSALRFIKIGKDKLISPRGRSELSRHLTRASKNIRRKRAKHSLLFSAEHLMAFIEISFNNLVQQQPFNFITASRLLNPVATDLPKHLINFVSQIRNAQDLNSFAAETIASSLLLDHYPPGMHSISSHPRTCLSCANTVLDFRPSDVFHMLYRDACAYVARLTAQTDRDDGFLLPSVFVSQILANMNSLYKNYQSGRLIADIHIEILQKYATKWMELKSQETCLVCLRRAPQHPMECGHHVCENCIRVFGRASNDDPLLFHADSCFLCHAESRLAVRIRSPTTGVGVLCVDGGGVRGIIPSTVLELLEEQIDLPIPIQEHFDLVLGTSAGALVVTAMFLKGWRASECTSAFENLADVAFQPRLLCRIPLFSAAIKMLVALFNDGLYRARYLENILKDTYGDDTKMSDSSYATSIGTKVGLPVATVSEPSILLFTNYNGTGDEDARSGYHVYRGNQDVNVWEVCFKPKYIEGVGQLYDAGVLENNPLTIALSELQAVYPGVNTPQFLVNLGTGSTREAEAPRDKAPGILRNNFIVRAFRAYMSLLQGRKTWEDFRRLVRRSSAIERYFRLDVTFDGPEPKLDDVTAIPELKKMVRADKGLSQVIDEISRFIIASLFYFELDSVPNQRNGEFSGAGSIFCLRKKSDPALAALINKLSESSAKFQVGGIDVPGNITDPSFWDADGNFRKRVVFKVNGDLMISLKRMDEQDYPISGAPFSVEKLVTAQGLHAHFGTSDHKKRKRVCLDEECKNSKRIKVYRRL